MSTYNRVILGSENKRTEGELNLMSDSISIECMYDSNSYDKQGKIKVKIRRMRV